MVEALPRGALEARDAADELGLQADVAVDRFDRLEVGEGLDPVVTVDVDPADVTELGAELLEEPANDVGPGLQHPVLDRGQDGGREEPGGLPVPLLEGAPLLPEIEREEQAKSQEQDADDEREDLGAEPLPQEPPDLHAAATPPPRGTLRLSGGASDLNVSGRLERPRPGARGIDLAYQWRSRRSRDLRGPLGLPWGCPGRDPRRRRGYRHVRSGVEAKLAPPLPRHGTPADADRHRRIRSRKVRRPLRPGWIGSAALMGPWVSTEVNGNLRALVARSLLQAPPAR